MTVRVPPVRIEQFCLSLLRAAKVKQDQADAVTRNIVWNELDGRANFGLERLPIHFERLRRGVLNVNCHPVITQLSTAAAMIDGDNGFGQFVGERAMNKAIDIAKETGIGACGARASNFYGSGAYFTTLACEMGMVGLALSNSFPKVVAFGGKRAVLGTNPVAFGAPGEDGNHLITDFATSNLAGSTVRDFLKEGRDLPAGLAIDDAGRDVTDPALIGKAALTPIGGPKGFGLSLMVEILSGVLTGAGVSHGVGSMYQDFSRAADSGHFFLAIDIKRWMPIADFHARMSELISLISASGNDGEVRLPGAKRLTMRRDNKLNGVPITATTRHSVNAIAQQLGCDPL